VYDYYTYHEARNHIQKRMQEANAERTARRYTNTRARRQRRRRRARMAAAWQMMTARQRTA
jgi:hypothetical protein